jgi:hypothetical protein
MIEPPHAMSTPAVLFDLLTKGIRGMIWFYLAWRCTGVQSLRAGHAWNVERVKVHNNIERKGTRECNSEARH